jgi:isocitrate dehydrogenase
MANRPVTVAYGDGIGPEIMDATLHILKEAGARIDIEVIDVGEKVYLAGNTAGHRPGGLGIAAANEGVSQGADHDSAGWRLQEPERDHAQDARAVRQCPSRVSYAPYVATKHPSRIW